MQYQDNPNVFNTVSKYVEIYSNHLSHYKRLLNLKFSVQNHYVEQKSINVLEQVPTRFSVMFNRDHILSSSFMKTCSAMFS